jgi:ribonuclease-3
VLELAIARTLYDRFPDFNEGRMAKVRSHVVSRVSCAVVSRELELGERLRAGGGARPAEELDRLSRNRNVLAAVLEAALAALYLEHGFEPIREAIVEAFEGRIQHALTNQVDHKTELQETLARVGRSVGYVLLDAEGPPHERTFTAAAVIDGEQVGVGRGRSKKDAEQLAAREALAGLGAVPEAADAASESARSG